MATLKSKLDKNVHQPNVAIRNKDSVNSERDTGQFTRTTNLTITVSGLAYDGLTRCANKYRTTRSHIADLVFANIHKLRFVDIVEALALEDNEATAEDSSADGDEIENEINSDLSNNEQTNAQ